MLATPPSLPVHNAADGDARRRTWLVLSLIAVLTSSAGCKAFSTRGPVPRAVAACQQLSQRGRSAMERGEWERAESLLGQAVQSCAVDVESRRHYAETLFHRGAIKEAVVQLEEARKLSPDDATLAVRLGELQLMTGNSTAARTAAEQALDIDPKLAGAWALRGRTWQAANEQRQALADFQRALSYEPESTDVVLQVAEIYRQLGQPERALVALEDLHDRYPPGEQPAQVLYLQGLALSALQRHTEAVARLREAVQRGGPSPDMLCQLAEVQFLAGRADEARGTVNQALGMDASHASSRALVQRMELAQRAGAAPLR